jgi:tetratricopeptide (TPR) repeat protein
MADKAMKGYVAKKAAMLAQGGAVADRAKATPGYDQRYYDASLVEAYALVALSSWKDAIGAFDIYLAVDPSAADILVDRGNAKLAINDKAGAEKDFRTALKFVPYDEQAKAGLKKIGVAQ